MLHINIAEGCGPTGQLLRDLLHERGVNIGTQAITSNSEAVVCWGNGYTGRLPALNRNATQHNKLQQLQVLSSPESHNLRTVPFFTGGAIPSGSFPVFMRKLSHAGGTDIRLALEPQHVSLFTQAGWAFATKYVPTQTEFRVWVYRRQHLGTYEKHLARPAEFLASRRFGANFDNGYAFRLVAQENLPTTAIEMAKAAVQALGLDFGAVDILKGRDGQYYILEVNTAPGVEGPDRQVIQALADKIAYWVNHQYPRRTGAEDEYERPGRTPAVETTIPAVLRAQHHPIPTLGDPTGSRPSFLPRIGESFEAYVRRVNA